MAGWLTLVSRGTDKSARGGGLGVIVASDERKRVIGLSCSCDSPNLVRAERPRIIVCLLACVAMNNAAKDKDFHF